MKKWIGVFLLLTTLFALIGCGKKNESTEEAKTVTKAEEPQFVTVQHILIGFKGTLPGKPVTRTQEEAKRLAEDLLKRAQSGENFDTLVKEHTDDSHPGIYQMANLGVAADRSQDIFERARMAKAFGDVGFSLNVGEIGMAPYDEQTSVYGWHIIRRIQ